MIIKCYNEKHQYLLFVDIEFNNKDLVQFAGLLFTRIEDDGTYQLMRSCNQYVSDVSVGYPFAQYTGITKNSLWDLGVPLADVRRCIEEDFLEGIPYEDLLVISHGLKNDRQVLLNAGINLSTLPYNDTKPIDGYCTFINAIRILGREKQLTLEDIANEAGYYIHHAHNAYNDAWAEVVVFTYLRKIEEQEKQE